MKTKPSTGLEMGNSLEKSGNEKGKIIENQKWEKSSLTIEYFLMIIRKD